MKRTYGLTSNLFVAPKTSSVSLVIGGIAEDSSRWTRVVSHRAALVLWHALTSHLFPGKAERVTGQMNTMRARTVELPTITHHMELRLLPNGILEIIGYVADQTWSLCLTMNEALRLWDALDVALQPTGWQESAALAGDD